MVYAEDVARAVLGALDRGGGRDVLVAHPEVLNTAASPRPSRPFRRGAPPARAGPAAGDPGAGSIAGVLSTFGKGPPVFNADKANELLQKAWVCDVSDAQVALGQPFRIDFRDGLQAHLGVVSRARLDLGPRW